MDTHEYVLVSHLCTHYSIDRSFFYSLKDNGLIEVITIGSDDYLHQDHIALLEKIVRINHDLHIDADTMDIIVSLLQRIENLQQELNAVRNHLLLYEG